MKFVIFGKMKTYLYSLFDISLLDFSLHSTCKKNPQKRLAMEDTPNFREILSGLNILFRSFSA